METNLFNKSRLANFKMHLKNERQVRQVMLVVVWLAAILLKGYRVEHQNQCDFNIDSDLTSASAKVTTCQRQIKHHGLLFAEAGKKKKEKSSEVIVISVSSAPSKSGGMYPMFIPSCSGGHKGHGGYGRRRRSVSHLQD